MHVLTTEQLPFDTFAHELVGADHGDTRVCVLIVDAAPGDGPRLHRHPYEEILITRAGRALVIAGDEQCEIVAGQIVVVPPNAPHRWVSIGPDRLQQIDIHVSSRFATEWLDAAAHPKERP